MSEKTEQKEKRHTLTADRFQVCDPELGEFVESMPMRQGAFCRAQDAAIHRGHPMEVCDVMARGGRPFVWEVNADGFVTVTSRKGF